MVEIVRQLPFLVNQVQERKVGLHLFLHRHHQKNKQTLEPEELRRVIQRLENMHVTEQELTLGRDLTFTIEGEDLRFAIIDNGSRATLTTKRRTFVWVKGTEQFEIVQALIYGI